MKFSLVVLFGFLATVSALPIPILNRRQLPQRAINDVDILQFALSLENLEASFYFQGLSQFSEADFRRENIPNPTQTFQNFHHILQHEIQHVKTLQTVISSLGGTPVPPCEYNFPFRSVQEFMAIANSLEKVGVSAYNGALAIMQSPDLQTAAATIDTVEARHASFLQTANGGDPFPENFDVALDGRQIITLASPFIRSCSFDLGIVPFGTLQVSNQIHLPESNVAVTFQQVNSRGQNFCNWLFADQSVVVPLAGNLCQIPPGARGDVYLMITNDQTPINLKKTDTIVAGPAIVTIDTAHTDSCKELFSGKKLKDGSVNQPIESGSIPVNGAIPQSGAVSPGTPSPSGVPSSTVSQFPSTSQLPPSSVTPIPPLVAGQPSNVSEVPTIGQAPSSDIVDPSVNATTNVPIDVNAQDPVIQEMFAELYATENGSPLPESTTSPSSTEPTTLVEPTVDPATGLPVEPAVDPATGRPLPTDLPVDPSPTTSPSDVPLESPPAEFTTPGSETQDLVDPAQETTLADPSVDTGLPVDSTTGLPLDPSLPSTEPPVE